MFQNTSQSTKSETMVKWFFTDHPDKKNKKDVAKLCEDFLNLIKGFVNKAHTTFP
jgi:hypothetical protein